ncbi:MAG: ATP-binding cassette domain-containing protein, partial [Deltaproteobacteria bacterium]|nr:ATP-binding cassette domain-containing protein [Deltaproteobacteria bacterium]
MPITTSVQSGLQGLDFSDYKIVAHNIGQRYRFRKAASDDAKQEFVAITDVNLAVKKGEFITVVGPSGCGKSTLLDILAGLSRPSQGEIYIDGKQVTGPGLDRGIVLQGYALFPWRTVRQNIEY